VNAIDYHTGRRRGKRYLVPEGGKEEKEKEGETEGKKRKRRDEREKEESN
jgi:hypothetical protein